MYLVILLFFLFCLKKMPKNQMYFSTLSSTIPSPYILFTLNQYIRPFNLFSHVIPNIRPFSLSGQIPYFEIIQPEIRQFNILHLTTQFL